MYTAHLRRVTAQNSASSHVIAGNQRRTWSGVRKVNNLDHQHEINGLLAWLTLIHFKPDSHQSVKDEDETSKWTPKAMMFLMNRKRLHVDAYFQIHG